MRVITNRLLQESWKAADHDTRGKNVADRRESIRRREVTRVAQREREAQR
jgi:tmRNA-binding protein